MTDIHEPTAEDFERLKQALADATKAEASNAVRLRQAVVEARARLAKGRAIWNGPCIECDAVLEQALRAHNDLDALREAAERRKPAPDRDAAIEAAYTSLTGCDICEGDGSVADGLDDAACSMTCPRCHGTGFDLRAALDAYEAHRREPEPVKVRPLVWAKSETSPWDDDWHTTPTVYAVRCADENGWKWHGFGGYGYERSAEAAKAAAQVDYETRIRSALVDGGSNG